MMECYYRYGTCKTASHCDLQAWLLEKHKGKKINLQAALIGHRLGYKAEEQETSSNSFWVPPDSTPGSRLRKGAFCLSPDRKAEFSWYTSWSWWFLRGIYLHVAIHGSSNNSLIFILLYSYEAWGLTWRPWRGHAEKEALQALTCAEEGGEKRQGQG